jgi:hypothetical protein
LSLIIRSKEDVTGIDLAVEYPESTMSKRIIKAFTEAEKEGYDPFNIKISEVKIVKFIILIEYESN